MSNETHEGVLMVRGKGTGFVALPDFEEDIIITQRNLNFGMDGDIVKLELLDIEEGERREGRVLEILERAREEFVGNVKEKEDWRGNKKLVFQADNRRVHTPFLLGEEDRDKIGMKVVAKIESWTDSSKEPQGVITEVLGKVGDHETEMQAIIRGGGFAENFPKEVQAAAEELYNNQDKIFAEAEKDPKRRDMRSVTTFTIDPADAKDFDDALSFEKLENGNVEVGIHIADVSHYVREGDEIDTEALERGTSIYLVDRVIPMLPEVLSNDLCSLRPNEDRLAFSAVFELNSQAEVVKEWYGQTIIHSDKRFTYEDAQEVLNKKEGDFLEELTEMMRLSRLIRAERYKEGAIAFEQPEVRFELDETGYPVRVYTKERTETMMMIEDFMLLANQGVAKYVHKLSKEKGHDMAFIYRIHDAPDPERIEDLALFLKALGYDLRHDGGQVESDDINKMLNKIDGKPEEMLIKIATIRSMAKAIYSTQNIGHFGLAFQYYTHFTSPIRRYPDLLAHRILRLHLDGSRINRNEQAKFERISVQSSEREANAVRAERDSIKYKQVEFMAPKVGEIFEGTISGVSDWGIYVEEKESRCEGMVKLSSIGDDFYEHLKSSYTIKGQKTGKTYRLGDEVKFKVVKANLEERQLDYELVNK